MEPQNELRSLLPRAIIGLAAVLALSPLAWAQTTASQGTPSPSMPSQQAGEARSPWKYYPKDRAVGTGGPAPKRDLSGTWAGPLSGSGVPVFAEQPAPPLTPLGKQMFDANKPIGKYSPAGTNDPTVRSCDPFGVPRDSIDEIRGLSIGTMPNRILLAIQFQDVWREIWMDGRKLPEKVDARGYPDSRFYGYSVGHWDGDNTLVIETTGLDERAWLDEAGHPRSSSAHITERYNRLDQYNMMVTVTVDDPKYYTKPWTFVNAHFYWMKAQEFAETICVPSEGIEYRDTLAKPSGIPVQSPN